jgi:hypothetical protein
LGKEGIPRGVYKENEILVKFKKGVSEERIKEINGQIKKS